MRYRVCFHQKVEISNSDPIGYPREGQLFFQKVMNSLDLLVESMRTDIAKDMIPPNQRRVAGTKYIIIMDTAERSNQEPLNRLRKEIIKK
jgi:hypothetical protein